MASHAVTPRHGRQSHVLLTSADCETAHCWPLWDYEMSPGGYGTARGSHVPAKQAGLFTGSHVREQAGWFIEANLTVSQPEPEVFRRCFEIVPLVAFQWLLVAM